MFIGWYSKKTDNKNKQKKGILADFDPFIHLTPSKKAFLCHFSTFRCIFGEKGLLKHYF